LIDCVNGTSGESLREMMVRAGVMRTTVLSGGGGSSSSAVAPACGLPAVVDLLALLAAEADCRD
jgi:hypothetical protein